MKNEKVSEKLLTNIDNNSSNQDEELAFIEYQENISHSKEEKRTRWILIACSIAIYLLGLGVFANIVQTIYQMHKVVGIVVGCVLAVAYTICFIVVIVSIFSKHSFDLEFKKRKDGHFSERTNNKVRWEIAKNISEQTAVIEYLDKEQAKEYLPAKEAIKVDSFTTIQDLCEKYKGSIPSSHKEDSIKLAEALSISMKKDGVIYKKAKSIILKRAVSTGCLTALSQNAMVDVGVVAVKNVQLIKDLIWLYGFRPTNAEMAKIMSRVIRNVSISIGLNTLPKGTNIVSKVFNKDSNNVLIQLLGKTIDMGAQFLGNGAMTYMVGKYTVNALLSQYQAQNLYRIKNLKEFEIEMNTATINEINADIDARVKEIEVKPETLPKETEEIQQIEAPKKRFHLFHKRHKEKVEEKSAVDNNTELSSK